MKKLLANILEPGSEQESGSEQGSGLETEPQSESGLWPSPKKEEESDVDHGQKEEIIPAALVSVSISSIERKQSPKNLGGRVALPSGKFLRVRKVFARNP